MLIEPMNEVRNTDKVKSFILEDAAIDEFGIETIGQAMLTAYLAYADSYVALPFL